MTGLHTVVLILTALAVVTAVAVVASSAWVEAVMVAMAVVVAVVVAMVVAVVTGSLLLHRRAPVSRGLHVWSSLALLWDIDGLRNTRGCTVGARAFVKSAVACLRLCL